LLHRKRGGAFYLHPAFLEKNKILPMLLQLNTDNWLWMIMSILAVWRLTTLICYEAGPFSIITKLRLLLYKMKMGSLIDCFHCTSIWISVFLVLAVYRLSPEMILLMPAVAGATSVIERGLNNFSQSKENTAYDKD
jgi:Protein of unknown function (DUF1360)